MASAPPGTGSSNMGMIIPAAIGAGASLGGAALGGKAAKSAAKTQAQTTDKTLAFAREQEAAKKLQYEAAMKAYQQKWEAWQAQRTALLQRYGVDIAPGPSGGYTGAGRAPIPAASAPGGQTLGAMALSPGEQAQGSPAMAQIPKWNDWAGMGLRQA